MEIHIPVPNDADSPKFKTTVGSVKWVPENSEIVWSIKSFPVSTVLGRAPPPDVPPLPTVPLYLSLWPGTCGLSPSLRTGNRARILSWDFREGQEEGWMES